MAERERAGSSPAAVGVQAPARWRAVVRVLRSPLDDLLTTVFPGDCCICAEPLLRASLLPVCDTCRAAAEQPRNPGCRRCGDALNLFADMEDLRFRGMECLACRLVPPAFERAVAHGRYAEQLREMLHLFKFSGMTGLADPLSRLLAEAILQLEAEAAADLLVIPVPLFAAHQSERGYNQATLLARAALKRLRTLRPDWRLTLDDTVLIRRRSTESQFTLSRRDRRRNLEGAFAVPLQQAARLRGREILLIDDILTSGATARECARVLRRAGAAKVWVATVARAGMDREAGLRDTDPGAYVAGWDLQARP